MLTMKFHKCLFVRTTYNYYLYRNIIDVHIATNYHVRSKLIIQHSISLFNCTVATWCIMLSVYFKKRAHHCYVN